MEVSTSPARNSAGSVEANRSRPGDWATYSGLMPSRSRAMTTRPVSRSAMTKANMPCRCETTSAPQR
jgi:hypothetical protein